MSTFLSVMLQAILSFSYIFYNLLPTWIHLHHLLWIAHLITGISLRQSPIPMPQDTLQTLLQHFTHFGQYTTYRPTYKVFHHNLETKYPLELHTTSCCTLKFKQVPASRTLLISCYSPSLRRFRKCACAPTHYPIFHLSQS